MVYENKGFIGSVGLSPFWVLVLRESLRLDPLKGLGVGPFGALESAPSGP